MMPDAETSHTWTFNDTEPVLSWRAIASVAEETVDVRKKAVTQEDKLGVYSIEL